MLADGTNARTSPARAGGAWARAGHALKINNASKSSGECWDATRKLSPEEQEEASDGHT
jgi:hypothetical protein